MSLVTLCFIILLPIVPAYLLFKAIPSSNATVTGPFKGLQFKLGGAFAGYFALVLVIIYTAPQWNRPEAYKMWTVEGKLLDVGGPAIQPLRQQDILVDPPFIKFWQDGSFQLFITPVPSQNGHLAFPKITIHPATYEELTIPLDPDESVDIDSRVKLTRDPVQRRIDLHRIKLAHEQLPAYAATSTPGAPTR